MTIKYPRLIDTDPIGEDHFTGGAQRRIADTIRGNLDDPKFKLIGLEGPWGSGKSNVVSILRNNLPDNYHFFIYDAWAHQEDLQRRSFLESLTDSLTKGNKPFNQKKWATDLRHQLAKKKITRSIEIPKINWVVILVIIVAALVPVANILVEDMKLIEYNTLSQLCVALTPFLLFVAVFIIGSFKTGDWQLQKMFAFYKKHETDKTLEETINEDEPNAAVFRDWLGKISEELVNQNARLIIVLDNMDRLPKEKVLGFWSHLHTFFSDSKYDNINVIVPYDRTHIQLVYGFQKDGKREGGDVLGDADYYINKTFPLVFTVPATVFTDWKDFFTRKYKDAFGEMCSGQMDEVRIIFNRFYKDSTPRDLITYLNEIVSLCLVWKQEIPIKYLALYTATRKDFFPNKLGSLLESKYADPVSMIFNGDENLLGFMAQLLYNIPRENAQEVILYRETMNAIHDEKKDYLLKLSIEKNFITILDQIFGDHISLSKFTTALFALENAITIEERTPFQPIWKQIIRRKAHTEKHANELTDTDKILLIKANDNGLLDLMGKHICQLMTSIQGQQARSYARAMIEFDSFVKEKRLPFDVPVHAIPRSLYGSEYIDFVDEAKDKWDQYKVTTSTFDLDSKLTQMLVHDLHKIPIGPYLRVFKFSYLFERIKQAITNDGDLTIENVGTLYKLYYAASPKETKLITPSMEKIDKLISEIESDNEEAAMLLLMCIQNTKELGKAQYQRLLNNEHTEFIDTLFKWRESFTTIEKLVALAAGSKWRAIILLLQRIFEQHKPTSETIDFIDIIPQIPKLVSGTSINADQILSYLDQHADQCESQLEKALEIPFVTESIVQLFVNHSSKTAEVIIKKVFDQLQAIGYSHWLNHFAMPDSQTRNVLDILLNYYPDSTASASITDALCETLPELTEQWGSGTFESERGQYTRFMRKVNQTKLKKALTATVEKQLVNKQVSAEEFLFFEQPFRESDVYSHSQENTVQLLIAQNLDDDRVIEKIVEQNEYYLPLLKRVPASSLEIIKELRKLIKDESFGGNRDTLYQFVSRLCVQTFAPIKILKASYATGVKTADPTALKKKLQKMVKTGEIYLFPVINEILGVDDVNFFGILKINYQYDGKENDASFQNGDWATLPRSD